MSQKTKQRIYYQLFANQSDISCHVAQFHNINVYYEELWSPLTTNCFPLHIKSQQRTNPTSYTQYTKNHTLTQIFSYISVYNNIHF